MSVDSVEQKVKDDAIAVKDWVGTRIRVIGTEIYGVVHKCEDGIAHFFRESDKAPFERPVDQLEPVTTDKPTAS